MGSVFVVTMPGNGRALPVAPESHVHIRPARKHPFLEAAHHPFIAGISHICSPLSAALLVFGIHKFVQRSAIRAWWEAQHALHMEGPIVNRAPATTTVKRADVPSATGKSATRTSASNPVAAGGVRQFTTQSRYRIPFSLHPARSRSIGTTAARWSGSMAAVFGRKMHSSGVTHKHKPMQTNRATAAPVAAVAATATATSTAAPTATVVTAACTDASSVSVVADAAPIASSFPTLADIYGAEDVDLVLDHLSSWGGVVALQDLITWLHVSGDLSWWASIAACTILLRFGALPFEIVMLRNSLRMKQIIPQVEQIHENMNQAETDEERQQHARTLMQLFKDKRCSPMHGMYIPFIFPPVFLSLFGATHNLALAEPSMTVGGALWFVDLVLPDPTWMLPVASSITWLALLEMTGGYFFLSQANFRSIARTCAVAFIPVVANMPAGVFCFWITANLFSMVRVSVLNHDVVRRFFGIPLRSEIASLAHIPRPLHTQLTPTEVSELVAYAKNAAREHSVNTPEGKLRITRTNTTTQAQAQVQEQEQAQTNETATTMAQMAIKAKVATAAN